MITLPFWVLILIIAGTACVVRVVDEYGRTRAVQQGVSRRLEWELNPRRLNDQAGEDAAEREGRTG